MSNFDVFGIGNALVDTEVEVSTDVLNELQVEKGLMTLVDQDRFNGLMSNINSYNLKESCGGSAANTVIAVSELGGKSFYACKVASDNTGGFYLKDMNDSKVKTTTIPVNDETTGRCIVFVTPDADRTMNTYLGVTGSFSNENIDYEQLAQSQYLYIEGYLVCSPTGFEAALKARDFAVENNIKIAITFSDPGVVAGFKDKFEQLLEKGVDLIFANEDEALAFTGLSSGESALQALSEKANTVAITCGPEGALIKDGSSSFKVDAKKVEAVDTNGAGDLFAGSFLYGITNGLSKKDSATLAVSACAELVTKFGARLEKGRLSEILKDLKSKDFAGE